MGAVLNLATSHAHKQDRQEPDNLWWSPKILLLALLLTSCVPDFAQVTSLSPGFFTYKTRMITPTSPGCGVTININNTTKCRALGRGDLEETGATLMVPGEELHG